MLKVSLYILASYLLGAIPFSIIIGYLFAGVDVRKHGTGNAGATNVYRVAGPVAAALATVLDVAKGFVPVLVMRGAAPAMEWLQVASGFAAVLGHIYPVFAGFRGGKGINTLLGMFLVLLPLEVCLCAVVFGATFWLGKIVSLSSLLAGVSLSVIVVIEKYILGKNISLLLLSACVAVTLLVLFTHRANIRRLVKGEERKFTI